MPLYNTSNKPLFIFHTPTAFPHTVYPPPPPPGEGGASSTISTTCCPFALYVPGVSTSLIVCPVISVSLARLFLSRASGYSCLACPVIPVSRVRLFLSRLPGYSCLACPVIGCLCQGVRCLVPMPCLSHLWVFIWMAAQCELR